MKRAIVILTVLVVLSSAYGSSAAAPVSLQPPSQQIDDLTPLPVLGDAKVGDSDERRIPEVYIQAAGGPDPFGYTYADSDGEGCAYDWIEIDTTGVDLELDGDDVGTYFAVEFPFPFCGTSQSTVGVSSNGYLTFGPDVTDYSEDPIPDPTDPNSLLAVFWDDQEVAQPSGDAVYHRLFGSPGDQYHVVEFVIRDRLGAAPYRYEAVLFENGDIKFQYNDMTTDPDGNGVSATVGIENDTGMVGLGYLYHLYPPENEIHNALAVCIAYPDNVYLSPGWQAGYGAGGEAIGYELAALNQTGTTQDFSLSVEESSWPAVISPTVVNIPDGGTVAASLVVTIPQGTLGLTETATVRVAAIADPIVYSDTAAVESGSLSGQYGYAGASTSDEAAVFDQVLGVMFKRLDILPEGDYPYDATISPNGREVWIPGASGDGVVVIDSGTNEIVQRIDVGEYPISVAFRQDGAYAFVSNRDTEDVTVVDTSTYAVVTSIPIPSYYLGPGNLALNPVGGEIYVVDWYDDHLFVLDAEAFSLVQEVPLGTSLWQLVVSPDGQWLYVTDRGQDVVHVLDTATLSVQAVVPVGDDPWGVDITADGALIYVANEDSHNVTAIDATDNSVITTITLPGADADPRDVDLSATGTYAYVTSGDVSGHDQVYVIDTASHDVVDSVDVSPAGNPNVVAATPQMPGVPDLVADKHAAPEPVVLGDLLTYTLSFTLTGFAAAPGALVTDTLPGGTSYLTSGGGLTSTYVVTDHQVIWELGTVWPGTSGQLVAVVLPQEEGLVGQVVENDASLDFTTLANLSATVSTASTVITPELGIGYPGGGLPPEPLLTCEGEQLVLAAASNRAGPLTYAWDLGDGTVADTRPVTHTWTYGEYTVWLTTTNAFGWVETDTLTVDAGHAPVAAFESNSPVKLGETAVFTDLSTYEPETWLWDFGDGVGASFEPSPVYTYTQAGAFNVALTVDNLCGASQFTFVFLVLEPQHRVYLPLVLRNQ